MMCLLNSFRVPGIDNILIYPDDVDPYRFYYFNTTPRLAVDSNTKLPMLSYMLIARNPDYVIAKDQVDFKSAELQRGALTMTTDLGLSDQEEKTIRDYLRDVKLEDTDYLRILKFILPKVYAALEERRAKSMEKKIKLGPVDATEGSCSFELLGNAGDDSFLKYASQNVKPTLGGDFKASFVSTFGREGSQLVWQALHPEVEGSGNKRVTGTTHAVVRYAMTGHASVPALNIKVTATASDTYDYFKKLGNEDTSATADGKAVMTEAAVEDIVHSEEFLSKVVHVEIEDKDGLLPPELQRQNADLVSSLIGTTTDQIMSALFEEVPALSVRADQEVDADESSPYYSLANRNEEDLKKIKDFTVEVNKNTVIPINLYSQGGILYSMTKSQVDKLVQICNLTQAAITTRAIPVNCYARFEEDEIEAIHVNVRFEPEPPYDIYATESNPPFIFKGNNDQYMFYVSYPASAHGSPGIDTLKYMTTIAYRGKKALSSRWTTVDVGEIVISYAALGYLDIKCQAFDIDWRLIEKALVDIRYLGAENEPDAKTTLCLTAEERSINWSCYKHGCESNEYAYSVRFIYKDGRPDDVIPERRGTSSSLIIDDMLEGSVSATFVVGFDTDTVKDVMLNIYHGGMTYTYTFAQPEAYLWSCRLRQGDSKEFTYQYVIRYVENGELETLPMSGPISDPSQVEPLTINKKERTLLLMSGAFPWANWAQVAVQVEYGDDFSDIIPLSPETPQVQVKVKARDTSLKFRCTAFLVDHNNVPYQLPTEECYPIFTLKEPPKDTE